MTVPLPALRSARQADPERRLRRLCRRLSRVTRPLAQADRLGRLRQRAMAVGQPLLVVALIALAGCTTLVLTSPWPLGLTLRHLAAGLGCPVAQAVGLAPARHSEPGWWMRLDPDLDGWSCASRPGGRTRGFWVLRQAGTTAWPFSHATGRSATNSSPSGWRSSGSPDVAPVRRRSVGP